MSFKINPKETVAFVGKSGVGKSTIFSLLCKMYNNYDGEITIDGINIKELDRDSIRGNITIFIFLILFYIKKICVITRISSVSIN